LVRVPPLSALPRLPSCIQGVLLRKKKHEKKRGKKGKRKETRGEERRRGAFRPPPLAEA